MANRTRMISVVFGAVALGSNLSATWIQVPPPAPGGETVPAETPVAPSVGILSYPRGAEIAAAIAALREGEEFAGGAAHAALSEAGDELRSAVFAALAGAGVDAREPWLRPAERDFLFGVVRAWPRDAGLPAFVARWGSTEVLAERLALLDLAGALGEARDLHDFVRLANGCDPRFVGSRRVQQTVRRALESLLERQDSAVAQLLDADPQLESAFDVSLARALATTRGNEGLPLFLAMLRVEDPKLEVIAAFGGIVDRLDATGREAVLGVCRHLLFSLSLRIRREAFVLMARTRESSCVDDLLEGLNQEPAIRRGVDLALRDLVGRPADGGDWVATIARERKWYDQVFRRGVSRLAQMSAAETLKLVRETTAHPMFRVATTREMVGWLGRRDEAVQREVCAALARLGGFEAHSGLVEAAAGSGAVATAARAALRALKPRQKPR